MREFLLSCGACGFCFLAGVLQERYGGLLYGLRRWRARGRRDRMSRGL